MNQPRFEHTRNIAQPESKRRGSAWRRALAALAFCALSPAPHAASYQAEGVAAITSGGEEQARQAALQDATRQIALQVGANVESLDLVNPDGSTMTSSRVRAPEQANKLIVLREWRDGDLFHVLVRAEIEALKPAAAQPVAAYYKKKIAAAPFALARGVRTDDIDDIATGFPRELLARLERSKKFLTTLSNYALPAGSGAGEPNPASVRQLADLQNSQFVLAGEILDTGRQSQSKYFGMSESHSRRLEVELRVYDGLTGALIARHRAEQQIDGAVVIGRDKSFGSAGFLATDYGKAFDAVLDSLAAAVIEDLEPLPFTARIVRIAGSQIYFDAGATSLIAPGDRMVAYRRRPEVPVGSFAAPGEYGMPEGPAATVAVTQVQPLFSIAEWAGDPKNVSVRVGDYVRFDTAAPRPR
jgi:TolB-like protein